MELLSSKSSIPSPFHFCSSCKVGSGGGGHAVAGHCSAHGNGKGPQSHADGSPHTRIPETQRWFGGSLSAPLASFQWLARTIVVTLHLQGHWRGFISCGDVLVPRHLPPFDKRPALSKDHPRWSDATFWGWTPGQVGGLWTRWGGWVLVDSC